MKKLRSRGSITFGLILLHGMREILGGYPNNINNSGSYGYADMNKYLPAPPGQRPPCAKNGATYCENVDAYPTNIHGDVLGHREAIRYLLLKYGYTYSLFIKSETEQEFMLPISQNYGYGPAQPSPGGYGGYGNHGNIHLNSSYMRSQMSMSGEGSSFSHYTHQYLPSPPPAMKDHQIAAAVVPILHSVWWNHMDRNNRRAFPYLPENMSYQHRVRKRQDVENQLCQVNSRFVTPEAAMNNEGNWMYVVNMPGSPRYAQQVRIETCAAQDSTCSGLCQVPPGYRAVCRQKFTQKRLVALDGSGSTLRNGIFWIPLCCVCEIQRS